MKVKAESDIWIDLTDMLSWSGHFTGIQRVVYSYASRYEKLGARFCAYDKVADRFFELKLNSLAVYQASETNQGEHERITVRRRIRRIVGKPYYALNEQKRAFLGPLVGATNFYVRYGISKIYPSKGEQHSIYDGLVDADFSRDDTVILLGASWNDQRALERLIALQQDKKFSITQHINDLLPIYQPQLFASELSKSFRVYMNKVIHHASVITVISKATKRDVDAYCKENDVRGVKVSVIRLGEDVEIAKPLRPEKIVVGEDFILALGTFEVRKNYILLYQAVKLAQLEGREIPRIVIAGRKGWLTDDLDHLIRNDPYAKERIVRLENVSDSELSWLYDNCIFSVFPSLAEGWGLPIVESLQHGKLCLASGVSSMLEIGDGLVDYFLPYDARECLEKISYYIAENRYQSANKKVAKDYKTFTWDESFNAFHSAAQGK